MTAAPDPDLLVTVDLSVGREASATRLRTIHALHGATVHAVTTTGGEVEITAFSACDWPTELARVCRVAAPDVPAEAPPPDGESVPWELLVGTGAALSAHRADLYDAVGARAAPTVRARVRRLHEATLGRLRAVGIVPSRHRVGWVAWVLHADGWRALAPYVEHGPAGPRAMVRLEGRRPEDLARVVARWASGVRR